MTTAVVYLSRSYHNSQSSINSTRYDTRAVRKVQRTNIFTKQKSSDQAITLCRCARLLCCIQGVFVQGAQSDIDTEGIIDGRTAPRLALFRGSRPTTRTRSPLKTQQLPQLLLIEQIVPCTAVVVPNSTGWWFHGYSLSHGASCVLKCRFPTLAILKSCGNGKLQCSTVPVAAQGVSDKFCAWLISHGSCRRYLEWLPADDYCTNTAVAVEFSGKGCSLWRTRTVCAAKVEGCLPGVYCGGLGNQSTNLHHL